MAKIEILEVEINGQINYFWKLTNNEHTIKGFPVKTIGRANWEARELGKLLMVSLDVEIFLRIP